MTRLCSATTDENVQGGLEYVERKVRDYTFHLLHSENRVIDSLKLGGGKRMRDSRGSQRLQADGSACVFTLLDEHVLFTLAERRTQFIVGGTNDMQLVHVVAKHMYSPVVPYMLCVYSHTSP